MPYADTTRILHYTITRLGTSTKTNINTNTNAKATSNAILHYTIQNSRDIAGTFGVSFFAFVLFLSKASGNMHTVKKYKDAHAQNPASHVIFSFGSAFLFNSFHVAVFLNAACLRFTMRFAHGPRMSTKKL